MPSLTIDNKVVAVPDGATILDAARKLGIDIPTLCFLDAHPPITSCMVCLVRVNGDERLVPSCATKVRDGMQVESEVDEVRQARRAALELLLSNHLGDCVAPCQAACPARIDIPRMIRRIAAGKPAAVAAAPCDTCDARCEQVCRRAAKDDPVAIRLLVQYARQTSQTEQEPLPATRNAGFSVHVGRVTAEEIDAYAAVASDKDRVRPADGVSFTDDEARREARRCLHCDCRAQDDCRLRKYAALYNAVPARYRGERRPFEQQLHPQNIIYEPGKCITCGLCIQIAKRAGEPLGLSFVGRGFDVRVAVPFGQPLEKGLREAAEECVRACPTGALSFKADPEES